MEKNKEIKSVKYYYHKIPLLNNVFTACILMGENNEFLSRGVAICSLLDNFTKKEGRRKSYSRAMKAYWNKSTLEMIEGDNRLSDKYIFRKIKSEKDIDEINKNIPVNLRKLMHETIEGIYKIHLSTPVYETQKFFDFKSEYLPTPTEVEKKIFRLKND